MSSDWSIYTVEQIAAPTQSALATGPFGSSISAKYFVESGVPVIRGSNLSPDTSIRLIEDGLVFVSTAKAKEFQRSIARQGDLIFTCWGTINQVGFIDRRASFDRYIVSNKQMKLTVDSNKADPRFIYYAFSGPAKQTEILDNGIGSSVPGFNLGQLKKHEILLPCLAEQVAIANLLESLDDRITLLRETNATLEAMAQALFKSWFVDFDPVHANAGTRAATLPADLQALFPSTFTDTPQGLVPEGWAISRLGDITERITKGTTPTTLKKAFTETGINFVKVESLTESGEFITEKFAFIDEETHQLLKRSQLQVGDVLVTIAGTIGRVAEVTEDTVPANTNQAVALIRPIPENLPSGLIRRFLQLTDAKQRMGERVVQAVQANLSLGSLSDMLVVVPPKDIVGQLYDLGFAAIDASKNNNLRQIRTLATLRDTLLPRLISGQLRLPDAEAALVEVDA